MALKKMIKEKYLLISLVLFAFIVRILFVWIGRPEFVGWFNHTYYYYVQTKGLIENASMPFRDMPLLFYLYALTSKVLITFGIETDTSIVYASRFWMSFILSLLPIPIFAILKQISINKELPKWGWIVIFAIAFYPLSLLYIPEFLQKNALGLLLLTVLIYQSIKISREHSLKSVIAFAVIFMLVILTHYGSTGAAFVYSASFVLSLLIHRNNRIGIKIGTGLLAGLVITLFLFYLIDAQRFERVAFYIKRIWDSSYISLILFSPDVFDKILGILMVFVPIGITWFFYRLYQKSNSILPTFLGVFWLSNLFCCYFLMLPIYDQLLLGRFSLYLSLPLSIVIFLTLQYSVQKLWIRKVVLGLSLFAVLLTALGEFMSLKFHNRNKEEVYADLIKLKAEMDFKPNDLIIGRNGVEHISNWFLGTKSCIITSFNKNDFKKYERVFILNPTERGMTFQGKANEGINRYNFMLGNVPEPKMGKTIFASQHLKLIELTTRPQEWEFDSKGNWSNYK